MIDFHKLQPVSPVGICVLGHHILDRGDVRGTAVFHMSEWFHDDPKGCEVDQKFSLRVSYECHEISKSTYLGLQQDM